MKLFFQQLALGPMQNFSYLLGDADAKKVAIVDPGWEADKILAAVNSAGLSPEAVWLTHTHYDHVQALEELLAQVSLPVYVHADERAGIPAGVKNIHSLQDGDTVSVGEVSVKCHHMPGHSPGMLCFEAPKILITGDMLFIDSCGRIDLPGSDPQAMQASLEKLKKLADDLVVYPGHDYGPAPFATLGEQKRTNPFLQANAALRGE